MKKWRCTVCGYIHNGDSPPENCPVCNATSDKFEEIIEAQAEGHSPGKDKGSLLMQGYGFIAEEMYKNHAHPISVHFPNGVLPAAVIFILLAILLNNQGLALAGFYNLLFVVITMPVVLLSGYISWQKRYQGATTKTFTTKIICAAICTVTAGGLLSWRLVDPNVMGPDSAGKWLFVLGAMIMLATAGLAGHLGGKLVFDNR
ncbi:MAG TPA: hypothetical protein HPP69_07765 [Deltaproteobacteria bacterium]|nr:hypothetical protein [Deltaproteobacteria bacterium]